MRCYHFGNFYLSQIQQGIQSAHAQMELFVKYKNIDFAQYVAENPYRSAAEYPSMYERRVSKHVQLFDWAQNHKTMICLNGGMYSDLQDILKVVDNDDNPYPWASFKEDQNALAGMLTNIAIVLPEDVYDIAAVCRQSGRYIDKISDQVYDCHERNGTRLLVNMDKWTSDLVNILTRCKLA